MNTIAHRPATLFACATAALLFSAAGVADEALERANRVLASTILVDGHNDLPWTIRNFEPAPGDIVAYDISVRAPGDGQTDLPRLRKGHVGAQFWSVYISPEPLGNARLQLEQIDLARRLVARHPADLQFTGTVAEIRKAHAAGRIASLYGMEGGYGIENSLGALRAYHDLGVRYMTLTHNFHTDWADSALQVPAKFNGLSPFGVRVVHEMNRLGMLVDLAHTSIDTMNDALDASKAPVIFSHAAARALCDISRNVPDEVIARLPQNGGVLMVTFVAGFLSPEMAKVFFPRMQEYYLRSANAKDPAERKAIYDEVFEGLVMPEVSTKDVADHIEHVVKIAGYDHVGLGGDFDGNSHWPTDLYDVSMYPNLFAELIRRGWSDENLKKLAGENVLRALARAEDVAKQLQATTPADITPFKSPGGK